MASVDQDRRAVKDAEELQDMVFAKRGCCFWIPFLGSSERSPSSSSSAPGGGSIWWERIQKAEKEERWWTRALKRLKEWSEVVAGPRWKTFIRGFNNNNRNRGGGIRKRKFQYDPLSYSLNFDEGNGPSDEDIGHLAFSARYASLPASAKSSMDLSKDGSTFT